MNNGLAPFPPLAVQRPQFVAYNGGWVNGGTSFARPLGVQPGDLLLWQACQGHDQSSGQARYNHGPGSWFSLSGANYRTGGVMGHFVEPTDGASVTWNDSSNGICELITAWRGVRAVKAGDVRIYNGAVDMQPPDVEEEGCVLVACLGAGINASVAPTSWASSHPDWKVVGMGQRWYPSQHCWANFTPRVGKQPRVTFSIPANFVQWHHCTMLVLLPMLS